MRSLPKRQRVGVGKPNLRRIVFIYLLIGGLALWFWLHLPVFYLQERITLVLATNPPSVLSVNNGSGEVSLTLIPKDTYIEVPGGFGWYRAGAVWDLGQIENAGGNLLLRSLRSFLGAPIDSWVGWKNLRVDLDTTHKEKIIRRLTTALSPVNFRSSLQTDFDILDRTLLWWKLRQLRGDRLTIIDLKDKGILVDEILPDGSTAMRAEADLVDKISQTLFFEKMVKQQELPIHIYNGTQVTGLGNKIGRLLTNIGYKVTGISNAERNAPRCSIRVYRGQEGKESLRRLERILSCTPSVVELPSRFASEYALVLGEDMAKLW